MTAIFVSVVIRASKPASKIATKNGAAPQPLITATFVLVAVQRLNLVAGQIHAWAAPEQLIIGMAIVTAVAVSKIPIVTMVTPLMIAHMSTAKKALN